MTIICSPLYQTGNSKDRYCQFDKSRLKDEKKIKYEKGQVSQRDWK
tara:strand:- start:286 stop:423 length:138 start_codon:yes stop_codon:yes gene_type:complete